MAMDYTSPNSKETEEKSTMEYLDRLLIDRLADVEQIKTAQEWLKANPGFLAVKRLIMR